LTYSNEAEWLALREAHIGGSDIASLFNVWRDLDGNELILHIYEPPPEGAEFVTSLSPYTSSFRIWQEKAGVLKPSFKENERVTAGKHLEPALATWAQEKWGAEGFRLRKTRRYIQSDDVPGWGASFDYELIAEGYPPVEFKNVDWLVFRDKWSVSGDDITPPFHINLQLQAQIGLTKADHGWIIVCIGGNELKRVRVERHEPTIERIRTAIEMFWTGIAAKAVPLWLADFDTVADLARYGEKGKKIDLSEDEAACRDARRYQRWKRHADYVAGHLDRMKARIGMKMGDATGALLGDRSVTWPVVTRAAKMQPEKWIDEATWRGGFTVRGGD